MSTRLQIAACTLALGQPLESRKLFDRVLAGAAAVPGIHQADLLAVRFRRLNGVRLTGETEEALPMARAPMAFVDAMHPGPDCNVEAQRLRLARVLLRAGRQELVPE